MDSLHVSVYETILNHNEDFLMCNPCLHFLCSYESDGWVSKDKECKYMGT